MQHIHDKVRSRYITEFLRIFPVTACSLIKNIWQLGKVTFNLVNNIYGNGIKVMRIHSYHKMGLPIYRVYIASNIDTSWVKRHILKMMLWLGVQGGTSTASAK